MSVLPITNWINNAPSTTNASISVDTPHTKQTIATCPISSPSDIANAIDSSLSAFPSWSSKTIKDRAILMIRFHQLLESHKEELANLIVLEHGKTKSEALAEIAKANETVEYAISLPTIAAGKHLRVSSKVECYDERVPLGVCAMIVPFNFPLMVPMWTLPIAITLGNVVVLKPSEKVPCTMRRVMELLKDAGIPGGVVNLVNGGAETGMTLITHPAVKAISFVGTSHVAELVQKSGRDLGKRVLALGGAKNHLVAAADCDVEMTATDVVNSFTGCCGQRCMAASVLLVVGKQEKVLEAIVEKASKLTPGVGAGQMGPVIDGASLEKIQSYIRLSEEHGAHILLDGRTWQRAQGNWIGPTIILHSNSNDTALHDEIFGPVLSVLLVNSFEEALAVENANPHGNAACIYTTSGATANYFSKRFQAGMIGVNVGVPVPREPFSFGGWGRSRFGDLDITGDGGMEFWTKRRKVTGKWSGIGGSWLE